MSRNERQPVDKAAAADKAGASAKGARKEEAPSSGQPPGAGSGAKGGGKGAGGGASLLPALAAPKGGGAIRGIGEKFSVNAATGTASLSVPIATSPGRGGFGPQLELAYDSGSGNGPFGLGFHLSAPAITRKTDKGLPRYWDGDDSDVFILAGAEDLVPVDGSQPVDPSGEHEIRRYQPRVEGGFARIERWTKIGSGATHWRVTTKDNISHVYGHAGADTQIVDPADSKRVLSWLLEESRDDRGNVIRYEYKREDGAGVVRTRLSEKSRFAGSDFATGAQRYLKRIRYGNRQPGLAQEFLFQVVFDYGEHEGDVPSDSASVTWPVRQDPFSSYRSGFEVRTYRLCRRVLMFHHFGTTPLLVRSTEFRYQPSATLTYLLGVTHWGYKEDGTRDSLPELTFDFIRAELHDQLQTLPHDSLEGLAGGIDNQRKQWVDLDGEGIPGVLINAGGAWYYKSNNGQGVLTAPRRLHSMPSPGNLAVQKLEDLAGDGQLDLVQFGEPVQGYFSRTPEGTFEPLRHFRSLPNIDWADPNLRLLDLDGDGFADALITESDCFTWYRSLAKDGFELGGKLPRALDEDRGPAVVFADGTETIQLADMSGDGLVDIVRVRNGEVSYWPNLGYGRFGAKVTLENSPILAGPDQFDPKRVRLGDVDGSGTSDLFYLGFDGIALYLNQSGNSLATRQEIHSLPPVDSASQFSVVDLLGNGTSCLVWSSPLPSPEGQRVFYVDLMGGQKPHLMKSVVNNLGAETRITYATSTKFYLADKAAGKPWLTRLSFPVQVVERIEHLDQISNSRLVSRYAYHHGFFDGVEREFRGFARVEQWDAEDFSLGAPGTELHQPPTRLVSWFHTGAWLEREKLEDQLANEYFPETQNSRLLPASPVDNTLSIADQREACRALRGHMLRQEIYAEDGDDAAKTPYLITEANFAVRKIQSTKGTRHGIFFPYPNETVTVHSERHVDDPRIGHELVLDVDDYGNVKRKASIAYGRSAETATYSEQKHAWATLTETDFINRADQATWYRVGVECEQRTWELTGFVADGDGTLITRESLLQNLLTATEVPYEGTPGAGACKRIIERKQQIFYKDDCTGTLPLGQIESHALPYQTYQLALTPGQVTDIASRASSLTGTAISAIDITALLLNEGRYADRGGYWVPSGYLEYDTAHFYLPIRATDPFANTYQMAYDEHYLLPVSTTDPLGNIVSSENDYRVLAPKKITDPNLNLTAAGFDALGMVVWTAVMGKASAPEGDTEADPTVTFEYNLKTWAQGKPTYVKTRAREKHGAANPRWQESYSYSDGFGRVVMQKVPAEPAPGTTSPRWVGTGRTVFNNKGNPVKQYEPFFSATPDYETEAAINGVTPIIHYDPLDRVIRTELPNGTESRVVFDAWQQESWDPNDAVAGTRWLTDRQKTSASPEDQRAATLALAHAGTPSTTHLDSLGRPFLAIAWNRLDGVDEKYRTRTVLDIEGNQLKLIDARQDAINPSDPLATLEQTFDVIGRPLHMHSADAGDRLAIEDVGGNPLRAWDNRGQTLRAEYDQLRRPVRALVKKGADELVVARTLYGESLDVATAQAANLRGQAHLIFDGAGLVKNESYDFKGNLKQSYRRIAKAYTSTPHWSTLGAGPDLEADAASLLEDEVFRASTEYDALNRVIAHTIQGNTTRPEYNEANLLNKLTVQPATGASKVVISNIDYNAKGQRVKCEHPGHTIEYAYDTETFRLTRLWTTRTDGVFLQDLRYTYDPVGNIVELQDRPAWQPFFTVEPTVNADGKYEYDAIYRLVKAEGREHPGQQPTRADALNGNAIPHPNDLQALWRYAESYDYDQVGNIEAMSHRLIGANPPVSNWTRNYEYATNNNQLARESQPGGNWGPAYSYNLHGSMLSMPHLTAMEWNHAEELQHAHMLGGGDAYFTYDAAGQRVRKVWEHGNGITEERIYLGGYEIYRKRTNSTVDLERRTLHVMDDQRRVAMLESTATSSVWRFQLDNHLGTSSVEVTDTGAVITYEEYHPYGTSALRIADGNAQVSDKRYRYTGKERDEETGLYYHGARYYAPWLGRWTAADPAGMVDGPARFSYSTGNPIRLADPSGNQSEPRDEAAAALGRAAGQAASRESKLAGPGDRRGAPEVPKAPQGVTLFVGVGENSEGEEASLRARGIALETMIVSSREERQEVDGIDLTTERGMFRFAARFGAEKGRMLLEYMQTLSPELGARDEVARLAQIYSRAERGDIRIERAIISGHHRPGEHEFFSQGTVSRTLDYFVLKKMAEIFPNAAAGVGALMLSGCNTLTDLGYHENPRKTMLDMFPGLRTIWGYAIPEEHLRDRKHKLLPNEGKSPKFVPGTERRGSLQHILRWEKATSGGATSIPEQVYKDLAKERPFTIKVLEIAR
jgi:RHS repeat-associated protein